MIKIMKEVRMFFLAIMGVLLVSFTVAGQTRTFTRDDIEFALDLPSTMWQPVSRLDVHGHVDFMYEDAAANGYLRIRMRLTSPGATAADLFKEDEKWDLQRLPGYVACCKCEGEKLAGTTNVTVMSYEYINNGRLTSGRLYYLQLNNRMFYVLHFTVAQDRLTGLIKDMDLLAQSFRLKR